MEGSACGLDDTDASFRGAQKIPLMSDDGRVAARLDLGREPVVFYRGAARLFRKFGSGLN